MADPWEPGPEDPAAAVDAFLRMLTGLGADEEIIQFAEKQGIIDEGAAAELRKGEGGLGEGISPEGVGTFAPSEVYEWVEGGGPVHPQTGKAGPQIRLKEVPPVTEEAPVTVDPPVGGTPIDPPPEEPVGPLPKEEIPVPEGEQPVLPEEPKWPIPVPEPDMDFGPIYPDEPDDESGRGMGPGETFFRPPSGIAAAEGEDTYFEPSTQLATMLKSWGFPEPTRDANNRIFMGDHSLGNVTNRMMGLIEEWTRDPNIGDEEMEMLIIQSEPYLDRFPGIRDAIANGLQPPTATEYLMYESYVDSMFSDHGLIADGATVGDLIGKGISIAQVQQRLDAAADDVLAMPQDVRDVFNAWTDTSDDSAILAWVLQPEKSIREIRKTVAEAQFGGFTKLSGDVLPEGLITTDEITGEPDYGRLKSIAEELSYLNLSRRDVAQGWGQIKDMEHLFAETMSEQKDLTALGEGVGAVFGTDQGASMALARRIRQRVSGFKGGGGAAVAGTTTGFGAANA